MNDIIFPESYNFNLTCGNCNHSTQLRIPMGIMIRKYAEDRVCGNCGCKMAGEDSHYMPNRTIPVYLPYGFGGIKW